MALEEMLFDNSSAFWDQRGVELLFFAELQALNISPPGHGQSLKIYLPSVAMASKKDPPSGLHSFVALLVGADHVVSMVKTCPEL